VALGDVEEEVRQRLGLEGFLVGGQRLGEAAQGEQALAAGEVGLGQTRGAVAGRGLPGRRVVVGGAVVARGLGSRWARRAHADDHRDREHRAERGVWRASGSHRKGSSVSSGSIRAGPMGRAGDG
jgi:hypothetical protein